MADTFDVRITKAEGWVEVADSTAYGFFTAYTGFYCEYAGQPPASLAGHSFTDHPLRYELEDGNSLYFRTDRNQSFFQVTPD